MSLRWKILVYGLLALSVIFAGYFGFKYYRYYRQIPLPPVYAVTPDALFFAEFPDAGSSHKKLLQTPLWRSLLDIETLQKFSDGVDRIDSVFNNSEPIFAETVKPLIISFYPDENGSIEQVFICGLPPGDQAKLVAGFIRRVNGMQSIVMQNTYRTTVINMVNIPGVERFFHYFVYRGLFIGSFDESLLHSTYDHLSNGRPISKDDDFKKIEGTAGKNVDANIYVLYRNLGKAIESIAAAESLQMLVELNRVAKFGEIDFIVQDSGWLFNGYSVTGGKEGELLNCFRQEPQSIEIPSVLPGNTAFLSHFGVQKFEKFFADYLRFRSDSTESLATLALLKRNFDISPYDDLISWIGKEFAIAGIKHGETEDTELLVVIHTLDALRSRLSLSQVEEKFNRKTNQKPFSLKHGDFNIGKINFPAFAETLFGEIFSGLEDNYYVLIRDYVMLANNPDVLKKVIDDFYSGKTLAEDAEYRQFSNNIADKSNIYLYAKIPAFLRDSKKVIGGPLNDWITYNSFILGKMGGLAIQFSFAKQMFYTNGYLRFNPGSGDPIPFLWSTDLKAEIIDKPYLIRNSLTGKRNILVFDDLNNLYLADERGRIQWTLGVAEQPQSSIHLIDYHKNGETQLLFNTSSYLHIVGTKGFYLDNFPLRLVRNATNGLSVFDYNNEKDYRLVIALDDNRIHNFGKSGEEIDGFSKIQSRTAVSKPVQRIVAEGKDYFFVTDLNGEVVITNRRGEDRINLKNSLSKAPNSLFYLNKTNKNGLFLTTDRKGNLVYIDAKGKLTHSAFSEFSSGHYFLYDDFDGDGYHDFLFLDGKKLIVYNRFKRVTLSYDFPENVSLEPMIFSHGDKKYLGVTLPGIQKILIFDHRGRVFEHLNLTADKPFVVTSLNNDNQLNLVTGLGNTLLNYILE